MRPDISDCARPAPTPVIAPTGELDMEPSRPWKRRSKPLAQRCGVVLDASNITFADSTFLRPVIATHHRTDLRTAAPSPAVMRLCRVTGADTFLHLHPTLEGALTA